MANRTAGKTAVETTVETAFRSGPEHYPLRPIDVLAIIAFWFALGIISSVGRQLDPRVPGLSGPLVQAVVRSTYVEYAVWAVLTAGIMWLTTRYSIEGGRRVGRLFLFAVLGVLVAALVDRVVLEARESFMRDVLLGRPRRRPPPAAFELGFLDDLMVYFAVFSAGVARDYFLRYRARLEETAQLQAQLIQARLDALRSQLNPHFLFNTLNAVSALVERDPRGVRRMIARLSDLLRYTLEENAEQEVPLRRELDLLAEYVELMQIRFQGKLDVTVNVDDDARDAMVPNLILQPIMENAIKHGVELGSGRGEIAVHAARAGEDLVITIADPGAGAHSGVGTGVGLTNTNARLRQMYGERYAVTLRARDGGGTEAEIVLPFHTAAVAPVAS